MAARGFNTICRVCALKIMQFIIWTRADLNSVGNVKENLRLRKDYLKKR